MFGGFPVARRAGVLVEGLGGEDLVLLIRPARWEATDYAGVGVERMQNVVDALGARITEKISFGTPARATRRARSQAGRNADAVPAKRVRSVD